MRDLPPEIEAAPMPVIIVGPGDEIVAANNAAVLIGFTRAETIARYLFLENQDFAAELAAAPPTKLWRFTFDEREKNFRISNIQSDRGICCWLTDMSEQLALAERLRILRNPSGKQLRQIKHQASTAIGYAELLDVIMDGESPLSADKVAIVTQYHSKVRNSLQRIQEIAISESATGISSKRSILLVENHEALNEVITELLKSEGYKVTSFLDSKSALQYFAVNHYSVHTAIVADTLNRERKETFSSTLKKMSPKLSIITLSANPDAAPEPAIRKPLDFKQLLRILED